ncbi:TetR family transcriptional regulator [Mycolicibacterium cyprinidarum]|uniref:TetR family transcriptional regulator n=1 Tax=Mycolicibacterium cyprinidarum TaxID=2860311 RepID=A0ABQ4VCK0_9MYCO|nr:TetR family transcriptional regulator [Mycolicibacterium sp. NGTWS0302]GJF10681.1 TetR family transcriptional regulator [Mycolicibacterium sp. NGTWSNA01]GJF18363.1 TetR family transcriptional regulator [Mycolicibacterium sp. NGTWS1803]
MVSPQAQPDGSTRRERRRLEVATRVLDSAEALFIEKGFDETTVAEICDAADVAYGTFFNHYPTKSDLLLAMGERAVVDISEQLDALSRRPVAIGDALARLFEGFAERLLSVSPGERALAARVESLAFTEVHEDRNGGFHAAFVRFIRESMAAGRVRTDVPAETLADLLASAYATMALRWVHLPDFPVRTRARALADLLAETLAPRPATIRRTK